MKELILYTKNLEIDFINANKEYQSKIDLGITSLVTNDFKKSKDLFDSAIELDSVFPSGWLGKAFAELCLISDENFNSLDIGEYIERAWKNGGNKLNNYEVVLSGCLAYRHSLIIKKNIESVENALALQEQAQREAALSATAALIGSSFTGKGKSRTSNLIGGAIVAGGVTNAIRASMNASEMKTMANSLFSSALSQVYESVPLIIHCEHLLEKIDDRSLSNHFQTIINSWKSSSVYLLQKQIDQLVVKLKKVDFENAEFLEKLLDNPNEIQEIGELMFYMKLIGLQNNKVYFILDEIFTKKLPSSFSSSHALKDLSKSKTKQSRAYAIMALGLLIGILWGFIEAKDEHFLAYILTDVGGIVIGLIMLVTSSTKEMKQLDKEIKAAVSEISKTKVFPDDIKFLR